MNREIPDLKLAWRSEMTTSPFEKDREEGPFVIEAEDNRE